MIGNHLEYNGFPSGFLTLSNLLKRGFLSFHLDYHDGSKTTILDHIGLFYRIPK
jgi:hypothetical protein